MIIIKTKQGDIFVNDKEMMNVTHNREIHTAEINNGKAMGTLWYQPPIEHVESVVYINEQTAKEWRDNGSELEYLRKENKSLELDLQCRAEIIKHTKERLRKLGHDCTQWVEYYHKDMPKDICKQMRDRGEEEKAYVNDGDDWTFRREWMQQHQKPDETEADEVARLNTTIEVQAAEIRELKDQIKRLEFNATLDRATIKPAPPRRPWWRRWLDI